MIGKRVFLSCLMAGGVGAGLSLSAAEPAAAADNYPSRAITFVMPFPAGPADLTIRLYADKLSQDWHQPAIVLNRTGATGTIGAEAVVKAAPDGYTLLFTVDLPITMAPNLLKVPYDPQRDLAPIAGVVELENVLVVNAATGIHTLAELVAQAKAKPGSLTFSSAGIGSPAHFCGEMLKRSAGIDMTHVPYKGAGPAMNAVVAGQVTMFCGPIAQSLPQIKAGRVIALGVAGANPSPALPQVPTLASRYPDLVMTNWFALFAPAMTPPAIREKVTAEFKKIFAEPDVQQKLKALAMEPTWIPAAELSKRIKADLAKWHDLAAAANMQAR